MKINDAEAIYFGAEVAEAAYLGSDLVWSSGPPVCSITITGDIAGSFGAQPMAVAGQTATYTLGTPATWLAGTPGDQSTLPPDSGIIIAEIDIEFTGNASPQAWLFASVGNFVGVQEAAAFGAEKFVSVVVGGSDVFSDSIPASAVVALGMDSSGNPKIYADGNPIDLGSAGAGMFASGAGFAVIDQTSASAGTGAVTFKTASYTPAIYPAGTLDWCGQDTITHRPAFTPDSLAVVGRDSYWTDVTLDDVKYQDAALTTPAGIADPVGGLRNLSAVSPSCKLEQSTTASKWVVKSDGSVGRNAAAQRLEFNSLTVDHPTGWLYALKLGSEGLLQNGSLFGGAGSLQISRNSANSLRMRLGSNSNIDFSGLESTLDAAETVMLSVIGTTARLYINGAQFGTDNTITNTISSYSDSLCIGTVNRSATRDIYWSFVRVASISTDGMASSGDISNMHDWLESGS